MWTNWKKDLKEIAGGITAVAHAAWELGTDWWDISSAKQKWVVVIVGAIVLLSLSRCASAEDAPDSNFGLLMSGSTMWACYTSNGLPVSGTVYTCLLLEAAGQGLFITQGRVGFCTVQGVTAEGTPEFVCGSYADMEKLNIGV